MDMIIIALVVGWFMGMAVGLQFARSTQPQITVVQMEPEQPRRQGCMPLLAAVVIAIIVAALLAGA